MGALSRAPLRGGEKEAPRPPPFQFRPPKKNLRFSLETLPFVPLSWDSYCSLVEKCTDSSPLWVLLQLLTPGAGVFSAVGGENDRIECALFLQGCAVRISTGCTLSFRGQRCMNNVWSAVHNMAAKPRKLGVGHRERDRKLRRLRLVSIPLPLNRFD